MSFPKPEVFGNFTLEDFADITMPQELEWGAIQPGWWVLLGVLATLAGIFLYRRYRHWKRNAYRRKALNNLDSLSSLRDLNSIIKRAAIDAYPNDEVSLLWGKSWTDYLNSKTAKPIFIAGDDQLFDDLLTRPERNWPDNIGQLKDHVRSWLKQHTEDKP